MIELDRVQGDIRFRHADHSYAHVTTGKKLEAVSHVISTIYSTKSWDGVDPAVVDNARRRGGSVDQYLSEYIRNGTVTIAGESDEVSQRICIAQSVFEDQFGGLAADSQRIVYSLDDGIAGTLDFWVDNRIVVDLKNTYSTEHSWVLQLGAYVTYAPKKPERCGVIHVSPKVYKEGGRWIEYDPVSCSLIWKDAVYWWKRTRNLTKHGLASTAR